MIRLRPEQVEAIQARAFRRGARTLVPELAETLGDEEASRMVEGAIHDAELHDFADLEHLERYLELARRITADGFHTHWGAIALKVLANSARPAESRLRFVERHLLPRIERDLQTPRPEGQS